MHNILTLLKIITRWPVLQKVHDRGSRPLSLLVNIRFQILFHSPPGVLFTFPSRYLCAIGHQGVFSLRGWSPCIPTGFHVPCGTRLEWLASASHTGLLPPMADLSRPFCSHPLVVSQVGLNPVRSPLLRVSRFLSFPRGT